MTMTKTTSRKPSGTYGHGPLKICFWKGKDDDHDQDFLKKDLLHIWSWSSDKSSSFGAQPRLKETRLQHPPAVLGCLILILYGEDLLPDQMPGKAMNKDGHCLGATNPYNMSKVGNQKSGKKKDIPSVICGLRVGTRG